MPPQQADPFAEFVVATDDPFAAFAAQTAPPEAPPMQGSGGATATVMGARGIPAAIRTGARFAANHPAATQKTIGAGISTVAGGIGAGIGGVPGAVVGASIRGVTPAQSTLRETAGRLAGETPSVAKNAGRAVGVANFAKETAGMKLSPTNVVSTGQAARAVDNYADSMGQKVLRLYDPSGRIVVGPEAATQATAKGPSVARRAIGAAGRILSPLSAMTGMTDFAQTVEPTRRDIGVMGIGASQPDPEGAELESLNARNTQAMQARLQQQAAIRAAILRRLGF